MPGGDLHFWSVILGFAIALIVYTARQIYDHERALMDTSLREKPGDFEPEDEKPKRKPKNDWFLGDDGEIEYPGDNDLNDDHPKVSIQRWQ